MTAAGVALLKAEELQLSLDAFEKALAHVCSASKIKAGRSEEESLRRVLLVYRDSCCSFQVV